MRRSGAPHGVWLVLGAQQEGSRKGRRARAGGAVGAAPRRVTVGSGKLERDAPRCRLARDRVEDAALAQRARATEVRASRKRVRPASSPKACESNQLAGTRVSPAMTPRLRKAACARGQRRTLQAWHPGGGSTRPAKAARSHQVRLWCGRQR